MKNSTCDDDFESCRQHTHIFLENPDDMLLISVNPSFLPIVITHSIIFFLGVTGNTIAIITWAGSKPNRSPTYTFLVSLAVADLLFLVMYLPLEILGYFVITWDAGETVCKLRSYIEMLTGMASVLNLTAISIERFLVISYPSMATRFCTLNNCRTSLCIVWGLAIFLALPVCFSKRRLFSEQIFWELHCCLATGTTLGTTLANAWHNIWPEGIFGNGDINDEEFSGFQISRGKTGIYELIEHVKSENTLSVENKDIDDWLSIDKNASTPNNLKGSEITDAVLNRTAVNASSSSEDEDEQSAEEKVSLEKCIKEIHPLTYHNNVTSVTAYYCWDSTQDVAFHIAVYQLIAMFVVPAIFMTWCYTCVIRELWSSTRRVAAVTRPKDSENEEGEYSSSNQTIEGKKKVIKMLILVIVLFHGCWGPRLIMNVMIKYGLSTFTVHIYRLRVAAYLLSFSHSAINPIIYGFMSTAFRHMMFQCCKDGFCYKITCCKSIGDKKGNYPHNRTDLDSYLFSSLTDSIRKSKQLNSIDGENSVILTTV